MRVVGDNGAWRDFQAGEDFNEDEYERFLEWVEAQSLIFDWLVLPDIVAGGLKSLSLSLRYMNRCLAITSLVLIAVQDGMEHEHLAELVGPKVGIFLGGSTEWKLERMAYWGEFCAQPGDYVTTLDGKEVKKLCHYHVARSNSAKRTFAAIAAGADSMDGSSGSRFAVTIPNIDNASRHPDLFSVARKSVCVS